MSRPLKFRVWSESDKEYRSDCSLGELFVGVTGSPATIYNDEGDCFIIEQWTGLKDKNNTPIYEGDIVIDAYEGDDAFIVEWDKDTAGFILTDTDHISSVSFGIYAIYPDEDVEVVGNIHENKKLVGEKEES